MDAIRKVVKTPFHRFSKHEKMSDEWGDYKHRDKVRDGVVFHVKYLGSILVSELTEEGQSYGDGIGAEAVKTIVAMAKAGGKKLPPASLTVSPAGLRIVNMASEAVISDLDIYRICFCTADRAQERVFAYIARNRENETMECHAFLCPKRKIIAKDIVENELSSNPSSTEHPCTTAASVQQQASSSSIIISQQSSATAKAIPQQQQQLPVHYSETPHRAAAQDLMMFSTEEKLSPTQPASSYSEFL